MPTKEELIANQLNGGEDAGLAGFEDRVAQSIGADRVVYQELSDLQDSIVEEAMVRCCSRPHLLLLPSNGRCEARAHPRPARDGAP